MVSNLVQTHFINRLQVWQGARCLRQGDVQKQQKQQFVEFLDCAYSFLAFLLFLKGYEQQAVEAVDLEAAQNCMDFERTLQLHGYHRLCSNSVFEQINMSSQLAFEMTDNNLSTDFVTGLVLLLLHMAGMVKPNALLFFLFSFLVLPFLAPFHYHTAD